MSALPPVPPSPPASSAGVRAAAQGNRSGNTKPELALRRELHRRGRRFRVHLAVQGAGRRCRPDIVFPRAKVAVFVDGCRWHCCPDHFRSPRTNADYWTPKFARNVARDRLNDEALTAAGWQVVRVWEHEDPHAAAFRVDAAIGIKASMP